MTYNENFSIKGLQEAQAANARRIALFKPGGKIQKDIKKVTMAAHRYAVSITHVDTGSLRASHRLEMKALRGRIYIDQSAVNPRSGQKPSVYGFYENKRGGEHAFYDRTVEEFETRAVEEVNSDIRVSL